MLEDVIDDENVMKRIVMKWREGRRVMIMMNLFVANSAAASFFPKSNFDNQSSFFPEILTFHNV